MGERERERERELSEQDVLSLIPPDIIYSLPPGKKLSSAITYSGCQRAPAEVMAWTEFVSLVNSYAPSEARQFSQQHFIFQSFHVSNKAGIEHALRSNVCQKLEMLVGGTFEYPSAIRNIIGKPDLIFHCQGTLHLVIEVKTKGVLPRVDDLAEKFNEDMQKCVPVQSTIRPIEQIFSYLSFNKLQYGVLTTYQQTWFLKRDRETLYISPTIDHDNEFPTLFQSYTWILNQAIEEPSNEPSPSPSQSQPPQPPSDHPPTGSSGIPDDDFHLHNSQISKSSRGQQKRGNQPY